MKKTKRFSTLASIKYIQKESEVTVSFDTDGGSKVTSQVLKVDEVAKKPSNPTRSGYKFVEWQLNGEQVSTQQN